ncbi:MAG: hypothetical protein C4524_04085 [Candidatus Zixiibacteriota bacterium]|nr:MAG: hypothetical protein C4524_04085 [candidate division Zixibacteria bacterium]
MEAIMRGRKFRFSGILLGIILAGWLGLVQQAWGTNWDRIVAEREGGVICDFAYFNHGTGQEVLYAVSMENGVWYRTYDATYGWLNSAVWSCLLPARQCYGVDVQRIGSGTTSDYILVATEFHGIYRGIRDGSGTYGNWINRRQHGDNTNGYPMHWEDVAFWGTTSADQYFAIGDELWDSYKTKLYLWNAAPSNTWSAVQYNGNAIEANKLYRDADASYSTTLYATADNAIYQSNATSYIADWTNIKSSFTSDTWYGVHGFYQDPTTRTLYVIAETNPSTHTCAVYDNVRVTPS